MEALTKKTLFVFVDESGNFDFSDSGTQHLVLSAVIFSKPYKSAQRMLRLKYSRMIIGLNTDGFHASEDRNTTREQVLRTIAKNTSIQSFSITFCKNEIWFPGISPSDIYYTFGVELANHLDGWARTKLVVLVFDKALKAREQNALFSSLKKELSSKKQKYRIYFQNVSKDLNAQIADYIAWCQFVRLERQNSYWLGLLPNRLTANVYPVKKVTPSATK